MSLIRKLAVIIVMVTLSLSGNAMSTDKKAVKEYNKALESMKKGKLEKAEKWLLKALKRDASFYEANFELGKIYYTQEKLDEAEASLNKAYEQGGKNAIESLDYLYSVETKKKNLDGRVKYALMKLKALGPDATINDVGRVDVLAVAYAQKGQMEKASALYNQLLQLRPDYTYAYLNLGKIYLMSHQSAKAYPLFQKAVDAGVDNPEIDYRLGGYFHDNKKYDKALPLLNKAAKNPEMRENVLPLIINCHLELKQYPEAIESCQTFLKEFPSNKLTKQVQETVEKLRKGMKEEAEIKAKKGKK
jgi:tetratricopeptide (TPR) repeat protein